MSLNPGDIIGEKYEIIRLLGQGGFGNTYLAYEHTDSEPKLCVVKEIIPRSQSDFIVQKVASRFDKEAHALVVLGKHPQIPDFFAKFIENNCFYLIQEYIEGTELSQEIIADEPWSEQQVLVLLLEILKILDFLHQNNVIHRDIKPSNLIRRKQDQKLVLIDFGAVKEIGTLSLDDSGEVQQTIAIGTPGYMPPEQSHGIPQPNSDIYALGMIAIQALTGLTTNNLRPIGQSSDIEWRSWANVSESLADVLDRMLRYDFKERYQTAREVLADLPTIEDLKQSHSQQERQKAAKAISQGIKGKLIPILGSLSILSLIAIALNHHQRSLTCPLIFGDNLSCGEEMLTRNLASAQSEAKKRGVAAFADGNYQQAITWFQQARVDNPQDPETLIYLNNSLLAANKTKTYTIAVAAPVGDPTYSGDIGQEMLRGVAQMQHEVNQGQKIHNLGLRVLIANDYDQAEWMSQIAEKISKQPEILAVIGHASSDATANTLPTYKKHNLGLISPTSTAEKLSQNNDFFLRTVPQDQVNAQALARYLVQQARQKQAIVLFNPNSNYSSSLWNRFRVNFEDLGGQIVKSIDLSQSNFNVNLIFAEAKAKGVKLIVLLPDAKVNSPAFSQILKVIRNADQQYLLVGGDSLYNEDILREQTAAKGLVIAIPWFEGDSKYQQFTNASHQLWQTPITWRTAMSYDAAKVLVTALKQQSPRNLSQLLVSRVNPTSERLRLWQTLKNPAFQTTGATGKISFTINGDRAEGIVDLVKVAPSTCSPYNYQFMAITDTPSSSSKCR